jgi:hypothetical protein
MCLPEIDHSTKLLVMYYICTFLMVYYLEILQNPIFFTNNKNKSYCINLELDSKIQTKKIFSQKEN